MMMTCIHIILYGYLGKNCIVGLKELLNGNGGGGISKRSVNYRIVSSELHLNDGNNSSSGNSADSSEDIYDPVPTDPYCELSPTPYSAHQ